MAGYRVLISPAAERQLDRVRGVARPALRGVILALATEPRPTGAIKLIGGEATWRIRVRIDGEPWRIVYELRPKERTVLVTRVVRRDEGTYRGL